MTDETPEPESTDAVKPWSEATDPDGYTRDEIVPKDWYLETILDMYVGSEDEHPGSIGITVTSAGAVVSGIAISRKAFIERSVELMREAGAPTVADGMDTLWNMAANQWVAEAKRRDEAELPSRARRFLHLRDARIWAPEGKINVPLWRGALADITGWSLGSHSPKEGDDEGDED